MGLFSKKNKEKEPKLDLSGEKVASTSNLNDPILKAVHERQPFEESANTHLTEAITPSGALRDVFGNPITNPDLSNPARSREERPLDTIRSFEYSTTGDERIRDTMESQRLGFRTRQDFDPMPRFETNPYSNNVISFGDPNANPEGEDNVQQSEYFLAGSGPGESEQKKKKKKGLFGKKK